MEALLNIDNRVCCCVVVAALHEILIEGDSGFVVARSTSSTAAIEKIKARGCHLGYVSCLLWKSSLELVRCGNMNAVHGPDTLAPGEEVAFYTRLMFSC